MGSVVSGIFGGGVPSGPSGPSAAELERQRKADEKRARVEDERLEQQSREKRAKTRQAWRRAGAKSTMATGSQGLTDPAETASGGLKTTLGG